MDMDSVIAIFKSYDPYIISLIFALPRMLAFLGTAQLLSPTAVPGHTRLLVIATLAFIVAPVNLEFAEKIEYHPITFAFLFAKEYGIGFILGYLVGWITWVLEAAGGLIDNQRGSAIASSIDPLQGHETSTLGMMFSLVFLSYLFITGAVLSIIGILYQSFLLWPVNKFVPVIDPNFPRLMLGIFDYAMHLSLLLAGPILVIMFLSEFSLAIISRFTPQVQVFVLAMPIKSILAIFVLILYVKILFPYAAELTEKFPELAAQFYATMRSGESILQGPRGISPP